MLFSENKYPCQQLRHSNSAPTRGVCRGATCASPAWTGHRTGASTAAKLATSSLLLPHLERWGHLHASSTTEGKLKTDNRNTWYIYHILLFSEKHQDGDWTGQNVRHDVLRHLLQTEAPGHQDAGGVQAGAALPQTEALHSPGEACWRGRGGLRSAQRETTSGPPANISSVLQTQTFWQ